MRRRLNSPERLEKRNLLAAYINEILVERLFGDNSKEQYIELRSDPGAVLPAGSYLVAVDSADTFGNAEGKINNIFDLSNLGFGSNGMLVLLQQGSPLSVHPSANLLQSTLPGFGGLPGGIYSDTSSTSNQLTMWQSTFFLIQTSTKPELGDDIDINSDGLIDAGGIAANWNIMDSVTMMNSLGNGHAYGKIAFVSTNTVHFPTVTTVPGTVVVRPDGYGYAGRIGNSTGWEASDWVGSEVEDASGDEYGFRFVSGVFGFPMPIHMNGRALDHVGSENFTAAARIQIFKDDNDNGVWDSGEQPAAGIKLSAEQDGNSTRDLIETIIEPDDFSQNRELDNLTLGVTLSTARSDNTIVGFPVQSVLDSNRSTGAAVFASSGIPWFSSGGRLRADFYNPAQSVSVDFIGTSTLSDVYGRLEAYDSTGRSIQMARTNALGLGHVQRLTVAFTTDRIAYVVAYADDNFLNSSPFGRLDRFAFSVPEPADTTDTNGLATFNYLSPGSYFLRNDAASAGDLLLNLPTFGVTNSENVSTKVPGAVNVGPVFETANLTIAENSSAGTSSGAVRATDRVGQTVSYSMVGTSAEFSINASTGIIQLKPGVNLNFENKSSYTLRIRATDNAPKPLSTETDFVVNVADVNEAPTLVDKQFTIVENSSANTVIGTITGADIDAGDNGKLSYRIVSQPLDVPLAIDEQTGQLSVANSAFFDFDARTKVIATVETFDGGNPSLTKRAIVTVNLTNVNESHSIATDELTIGELALSGTSLGKILVADPDADQTYTYKWADGFTSQEFVMNDNTGEISLREGALLSFLNKPLYTLPVTVVDRTPLPFSATKDVTIRVLDENNAPTLNNATLEIFENSAGDTEVGTITASDVDVGQTFTYSLLGGGNLFSIDSSSGVIRSNSGTTFNFETQPTQQVIVQATDSGTPAKSSVRTFTVSVKNVNEPPVVFDASFSLAEAAVSGASVGKVTFGDPDSGESATIKLIEGPNSSLFTIEPTTGILRVAPGATFDFETVKSYTLSVQATDGVNSSVNGSVAITITNSNDAPVSGGDLGTTEVLAGYSLSYVVPLSAAIDPDAGQSITYAITASGGGSLPSWLTYNTTTRTLSGTPWNPQAGIISLSVVATDSGSPRLSTNIPLQVKVNFNQNPWKNRSNALDVSGNGTVTPSDALQIIDRLNSTGGFAIPVNSTSRPSFLDVNGDNRVSGSDALAIINHLNARSSGEGEASNELPTNTSLSTQDALQAMAVDSALMDLIELQQKRIRRA